MRSAILHTAMSTLHGEPTETIYVRIPRSVKIALDKRRKRERRSLAMVVSIALEDWLRERGELPLSERVTA